MPIYIRKNGADVLREVLKKLQDHTPITSTSPGSIARALAEAVTSEIGDLYDTMDYNLNQNLLTTATGSALDLLGSLYNVQRKTVNNLSAIDKQIGSFYFYVVNPVAIDITIPAGTAVFTDATSFTGRRFSYKTAAAVTIVAGRTKAYAGLIANFADSVSTAGPNTLILHDFQSPANTPVFCTNPKEIAQKVNYEDDNTYRLRIIKNIRVSTGGSLDALRFAGLSVSGVRDIQIRQSPYGMGSFEVIITPEQNGDTSQTIVNAQAALEAVRPLGSRMFVKFPITVPLDVSVNLIMPGIGVTTLSDQAQKRALVAISRYINTLLPGTPFLYNRMIGLILDSSELVKDVIVNSLALNGKEILRKNYTPATDEQIVAGNITINVATA